MTEERKQGRPRLYDSPESMQKKIDEYFEHEDEAGDPYTVPGLAYFLGFCDRGAVLEYEKYEGFSPTIKKARLRIEQQRNKTLLKGEGNVAGQIFDLKNNFGWTDKTVVESTNRVTIVEMEHDEDI
jgi:hypothetical protein